MALIAQPFRHPDSGIYYLRRRVPDDLRQVIGKTKIRRSLKTRNHHQAKAAFAIAFTESERVFSDARNGLSIEWFQPDIRPPSSPRLALSTPPEPLVKLSQVLGRYIQSVSMSGRSEYVLQRHTVDYGRAVNRFITKMGDQPITAIQPSDIHAFAADLIQPKDADERPLATSTTRLLLARLSSVLAFAVDSGLLESNPVLVSRIHKRLGPSKPKRRLNGNRGYTWNELITLFGHPEFQRLRYAQGRPGNAVFWLPLISLR